MWYIFYSSIANFLEFGSPIANLPQNISEQDLFALFVDEQPPLLLLAIFFLRIDHTDKTLGTSGLQTAALVEKFEALFVFGSKRSERTLPEVVRLRGGPKISSNLVHIIPYPLKLICGA